MATERILHPEWRDEQGPSRYPFADRATLVSADSMLLPPDLFLDATFYPIGGQEQLRLSSVVIDYQTVTLWIGDNTNDSLASASFSLLSPPSEVRFLDAYGRPAGLGISTPTGLAVFQSWPVGSHNFTVDETEFAATCCIPTPEIGVRGILLADGSLFTGDVWLIGGDGVALTRVDRSTNRSGILGGPEVLDTVHVDIVGDPLFRRRLCTGVFATSPYLQQITVQDGCRRVVCYPDVDGDFKITVGHQEAADTVLRIRATPDGIVVETVGEVLRSITN
jgi:hypothetical protein